MEQGQSTSILGPIIAFTMVAVFWVLSCYVAGIVSGWKKLGKRFKRGNEPTGETLTYGPWLTAMSSRYWMRYNNIVRLEAAQDGLYMSVILPMRFGHPSLFLPWNEVSVKKVRHMLRSYVELSLGNEEKIPFRIAVRGAEKLGLPARYPELNQK